MSLYNPPFPSANLSQVKLHIPDPSNNLVIQEYEFRQYDQLSIRIQTQKLKDDTIYPDKY